MHLLLMAWLAMSVRDGGAALRSGCDADSTKIAQLAAGTPVTIRFSLSGQSEPCYKVVTTFEGNPVEGYLPGAAIADLDTFETARKAGSGILVTREVLQAVGAPSSSRGANGSLSEQAAGLIESAQPSRALALLEPELKRGDPQLLALAGAAAWRADDPQRALDLWRRSLAIRPNREVQELVSQVQRETQGDQSKQRIYGARVLLRYEDTAVSPDTARAMAAVVDQEFARISGELGCSATERIVTIAQSKDSYVKTTAAAEWSAGQFDGRIRVPVFDGRTIDPEMRRTLAHEVTHACLTMLGRWPAWLHEGVAQSSSGQALSAAEANAVLIQARAKRMTLSKSAEEWSNLDADSARLAYQLALHAIEVYRHDHGSTGLRNLLRTPERLTQVTADLDRRLGL